MAASKPELVAELLREAELVVKEAPPAVRGDMLQVALSSLLWQPFTHVPTNCGLALMSLKVGAPVGPQEGGIYSTFATLGTRQYLPAPPYPIVIPIHRHHRVTPFGPFYLPSSADPSSIECLPGFLSLGGRALVLLGKLLLAALLPPTLILLCICRRSKNI